MISKACINRFLLTGLIFLSISFGSQGQVNSGRIVFERKTNLKKMMGDNPRMKNFITEKNKYRIENFELFFNDTSSVFKPMVDEEPVEGFLKYFTQKNTVYLNIATRQKYIEMDLFGTPAFIKDTMETRLWKVTESKRVIAGYSCRKAIWQMNDSTRIYAWFAPDIVPSVGPEGFEGLPGAILGLATEDGSIIYFAKEVTMPNFPKSVLKYAPREKNVYTKRELIEELKVKMSQWVKPKDLEAMFSWL